MKPFTIPNQLANKLESDAMHLLTTNKPVWRLLTGMENYSPMELARRKVLSEAANIPLKEPTCLFDPIYYSSRDYQSHGTFEQMIKKVPPAIPSIVNLVNYLRDTYLDPSYDLCRLYVNLLSKAPRTLFPPHMDWNKEGSYTFLYYIIDSDGETFVFDKDTNQVAGQALPKKGTGIYFPSSTIHAASTPVVSEVRLVANVVFCKDFFKQNKM
jgi:2OG-Fe(II) oxygenase superfamily